MRKKKKLSDGLNMIQGNIGSIYFGLFPYRALKLIAKPVVMAVDIATVAVATANVATNIIEENKEAK